MKGADVVAGASCMSNAVPITHDCKDKLNLTGNHKSLYDRTQRAPSVRSPSGNLPPEGS